MELLDNLLTIGFTEYEAKVYLALLRSNPANGYQISKESGVPRSMVYEALGRLNMRGAVLKTEVNRSTLYRPLPPDVLLDRYEQEHRSVLEGLRAGLQEVFTQHDEGRFWSITGRNSVLSYASQMIQSAEEEVLLVLSDPDLEALREDIETASAKGARISTLLSGEGELTCGRVARHSSLERELQDLTQILVVVADNKETLIASTDYDMSATITGNRNLVMIARQFIWMELFTQRVSTRLGPEQFKYLEPEDRLFFEGLAPRL
jgi:HTH-type transcriptional regulator, sugar sensing transcriptional regulator